MNSNLPTGLMHILRYPLYLIKLCNKIFKIMFFFDKFEFTVGDSFKSFVFMERAVILNTMEFCFPMGNFVRRF